MVILLLLLLLYVIRVILEHLKWLQHQRGFDTIEIHAPNKGPFDIGFRFSGAAARKDFGTKVAYEQS